MKNNEKGFSVVEVLIVVVIAGLIGTVGWLVYDRQSTSKKTVSTPTTSKNTQQKEATKVAANVASPYKDWKEYENKSLALKFKYPADWKIVDESSNLGTLIRVQSPDYVRETEGIGYSGTQISISPNTSHNTYNADKQNAATNTHGYHNDVKDLTVGGKPSFSYSKTLNETGYTVFYVEVDLGEKGAKEFLYQSNTKEVPQKYDTTNLTIFNMLLDSVTF